MLGQSTKLNDPSCLSSKTGENVMGSVRESNRSTGEKILLHIFLKLYLIYTDLSW